ncbi:uncharacterized protein [Miscanthus floridulus]|uniref:uncharacterized protein n=1 Tax=Miscanthus floridulus TaxID=154761 RepID=UPI0034574F1A
MEDLLPLDESAGHAPPDPQSAGDTSHSTTIAGLRQAVLYPVGLAGPTAATTGAEDQHEQNVDPPLELDWTGANTVLPLAATNSIGMEEIPNPWNPLLGFNMGEINAVLTSTAAVNDNILSVENPPREPTTPVVNVGLAMPGPDRDPYSTGVTSCPPASAAADTGNQSPDLEVNATVGLPQSGGGGALTEAPVRGSSKRKCLNSSSTEADLVRSDPSSAYINYPTGIDYRGIMRQEGFTDIEPPDGSTPLEIIQSLNRTRYSMLD